MLYHGNKIHAYTTCKGSVSYIYMYMMVEKKRREEIDYVKSKKIALALFLNNPLSPLAIS